MILNRYSRQSRKRSTMSVRPTSNLRRCDQFFSPTVIRHWARSRSSGLCSAQSAASTIQHAFCVIFMSRMQRSKSAVWICKHDNRTKGHNRPGLCWKGRFPRVSREIVGHPETFDFARFGGQTIRNATRSAWSRIRLPVWSTGFAKCRKENWNRPVGKPHVQTSCVLSCAHQKNWKAASRASLFSSALLAVPIAAEHLRPKGSATSYFDNFVPKN